MDSQIDGARAAENDSLTEDFIKKYGRIFATELDAFFAVAPNELRRLIQRSRDQHFDKKTLNQVMTLTQHSVESISRLVNQRVRFLD
ncbi:MAG: hypothetical protein ACJ71P_04710 [Nitrososphaeraceae archaeon]